MNTTINYYNLNAKNFIENTQNADMHVGQMEAKGASSGVP